MAARWASLRAQRRAEAKGPDSRQLTVELGKKLIEIHFVINGLKDGDKLSVSDYAGARLRRRACR